MVDRSDSDNPFYGAHNRSSFLRALVAVCTSKHFHHLILLQRIFNFIFSPISLEYRSHQTDIIGVFITTVCVIFWFMRIIVYLTTSKLLKHVFSIWVLFDTFITLLAVIADSFRRGNGQYICIFQIFTLFRVMIFSYNFRFLIIAIITSITVVAKFMGLLAFLIIPSATLVTAFVGKDIENRGYDADVAAASEEYWGTFLRSCLTIFQITTFDWSDIARSFIKEPYIIVFIILYIFIVGFGVSNIFITVIGETYTAVVEKYDAEEKIEPIDNAIKTDIFTKFVSNMTIDIDDSVKDVEFSNQDIAKMIIMLHNKLIHEKES